jgi:hypothetical protein
MSTTPLSVSRSSALKRRRTPLNVRRTTDAGPAYRRGSGADVIAGGRDYSRHRRHRPHLHHDDRNRNIILKWVKEVHLVGPT